MGRRCSRNSGGGEVGGRDSDVPTAALNPTPPACERRWSWETRPFGNRLCFWNFQLPVLSRPLTSAAVSCCHHLYCILCRFHSLPPPLIFPLKKQDFQSQIPPGPKLGRGEVGRTGSSGVGGVLSRGLLSPSPRGGGVPEVRNSKFCLQAEE